MNQETIADANNRQLLLIDRSLDRFLFPPNSKDLFNM